MDGRYLVLVAALGCLCAGLLLGWLLTRGRQSAAADLARSDAAVRLATAIERERALEAQVVQLQRERAEFKQLRVDDTQEILRLSTALAELSAGSLAERRQADEKLALLVEAREAMSNQFKSLASDILEDKSRRFTEQNQINLGQLLDPLRARLQEFQGKVEEVYVQEGKDRSALAEQVRHLMDLNLALGTDARNLTRALKGSSKTQGNWGELVLERVLEHAGLRLGHEYDRQESHVRDDGSRAQPDVVLHLPEDRHLVVDAKVSLTAYEEFASTEDDALRPAALRRHLDSIRAHIRGLSDKNYQELYALKSLDFVLMFVPIEPAFMVAVTHDNELFMEAWKRNVLLVSPSTLLFVVRTVAHLWRQEAQGRNAQEIAQRGAELYDRLCAFVEDFEKVGQRLSQAHESYSSARDRLSRNRGNVIRQAQMLRELGVKPTKSLPQALVEAAGEDLPAQALVQPSVATTASVSIPGVFKSEDAPGVP